MPRPAKTWLITDTHFYHDVMVKMCGRPENFTDLIIRNMRYLVAEQDLLIHLGDVIFYKYPVLKEILASIAGTKLLLMGNHDRKSKGWYVRAGFAAAADMLVMGNVLFSHKPVEHLPTGVEFNIHGHFHNNNHRASESWYDVNIHKKLAIEEVDYKPILLHQFLPQAAI